MYLSNHWSLQFSVIHIPVGTTEGSRGVRRETKEHDVGFKCLGYRRVGSGKIGKAGRDIEMSPRPFTELSVQDVYYLTAN